MSALERFGTTDPMADLYPDWTSYHYAANNPTRIIDPSGKFWVNAIKSSNDVRAGRVGTTGAYMLEELQAVPGVGNLIFTAGRKLWLSGNSDYSALNPSWQQWMGGAVAAYSQLGTPLPPGSPSTRIEDPNYMSPTARITKADELTFKVIAGLVRDFEGPKATVGDESYNLIDDIGGGDQAFSLGLNRDLKNAWEDIGIDPVDEFADELGKHQGAALNIMENVDGKAQQRKRLRQWIQATNHAESKN